MWYVDDFMTGFWSRGSERNDEVAVSGSQGADFQITDPTSPTSKHQGNLAPVPSGSGVEESFQGRHLLVL